MQNFCLPLLAFRVIRLTVPAYFQHHCSSLWPIVKLTPSLWLLSPSDSKTNLCKNALLLVSQHKNFATCTCSQTTLYSYKEIYLVLINLNIIFWTPLARMEGSRQSLTHSRFKFKWSPQNKISYRLTTWVCLFSFIEPSSLVPRYLLSSFKVRAKTSNYLLLTIHFSKARVQSMSKKMSGVCNYRENKAVHPDAF